MSTALWYRSLYPPTCRSAAASIIDPVCQSVQLPISRPSWISASSVGEAMVVSFRPSRSMYST